MSFRQPFAGMRPGENLDGFHQRCVAYPNDDTVNRNREIDQFVRFLHGEFGQRPYTVAKVVKSGSLGKGTAVKWIADTDLVVFVNGLSSIQDLDASRQRLLDDLDRKVNSYGPWRGRIQRQSSSRYLLSYTLDGQEVDVLPAFDVITAMGGKGAVYRSMASYPGGPEVAGQQYSVSLAPLQIDFVKQWGEDVKKVIRLLKFWKQENNLKRKITSFTLELITIHEARSMGARGQAVMTKALFQNVLRQLRDCASLRIAFNDNYNSRDYQRYWSVPYVMDPANPYNNTLYSVDIGAVSAQAARTLQCL